LAGTLAGFLIIKYIDNAIYKHEIAECLRWQEYAVDYADAGFYLTTWQEKQCETIGYPVKLKEPLPRKDFEL